MLYALWRFLLSLVFITSLLAVLAIIWDVPDYLGYPLPGDLAKLPSTLLILLALLTGIIGAWSRPKLKAPEARRNYPSAPLVPRDDVFSVPASSSRTLSPVEQANQ